MGAYVSVSERQRRGNARAQRERDNNTRSNVTNRYATSEDFLRTAWINSAVNSRQ